MIPVFAPGKSVSVVCLSRWLNWAGGKTSEQFIALPMIQRGSVWKPHQIIDLWDSVLQGMPVGSIMVSELQEGTPVRRLNSPHLERLPAGGGLALIDGQQRTLAMLAAWPQSPEMDRRIWIDFAGTPPAGHLLRLRVTTANNPFGFQLDAPSRKLPLKDRCDARSAFVFLRGERLQPTVAEAWPFSREPGLPIDLRRLICLWHNRSSRDGWCSKVEAVLQDLKAAQPVKDAPGVWREVRPWQLLANPGQVIGRIRALADALSQLDRSEIPLIQVHPRFFETAGAEASDPPLAVLFKRIGTGGAPLSDADYVYSVIKHLRPETHDLVEGLHAGRGGDKTVASLLTATDLVLSAVRLAAVGWEAAGSRPVPDFVNPSKQDFHRLLLRGDFIREAFLPLIEEGAESIIAHNFKQIQGTLTYRSEGDAGLPKHAFPLLQRPLVQVLLLLAQVDYLDSGNDALCRDDVLRLVLFWLIAVTDPLKASRLAYEVIRARSTSSPALGRAIHDRLVAEEAAVRLPKPKELIELGLAFSPSNAQTLLGESRFGAKTEGQEGHPATCAFYHKHWWRPWTYHHPILLWLQREMVARRLDANVDPMAGRDEDTPYDYDHVLPYSHWGDWRGVRRSDTLRSFGDGQIYVVGNSIGNVRVWESSLNRSDGDDAPKKKLKLDASLIDVERESLLRDSAIEEDQAEDWMIASGPSDQPRSWSRERALAFQRVVERRAFALYRTFYETADFSKWE